MAEPGAWSLQAFPLIRRDIRQRCVLAALKDTNVGRYRPAIRRGDSIGERIHGAVALRHHVVEVLNRCLPEAIRVIRGRRRKTSLDNHAATVADFGVTRRAVNAESLLATLQQGEG